MHKVSSSKATRGEKENPHYLGLKGLHIIIFYLVVKDDIPQSRESRLLSHDPRRHLFIHRPPSLAASLSTTFHRQWGRWWGATVKRARQS